MIGRLTLAALVLGAGLVGEAAAQGRGDWISCAQENGFCRVPYPTKVRYGARGSYVDIDADRGVPCNNQVFGDPAVGVRKACWYLAGRRGGWDDRGPGWGGAGPGPGGWGGDGDRGGWRTCAEEGEWCDFRGGATVRYGLPGRWVTVRARDGVDCSNYTFGDPVVGRRKICQVGR